MLLKFGFNGAAAGQPRKDQAPAADDGARLPLQWGRGWTAAEGSAERSTSWSTGTLQWGRGWTAAEGE